jgi:hypothetical protein
VTAQSMPSCVARCEGVQGCRCRRRGAHACPHAWCSRMRAASGMASATPPTCRLCRWAQLEGRRAIQHVQLHGAVACAGDHARVAAARQHLHPENVVAVRGGQLQWAAACVREGPQDDLRVCVGGWGGASVSWLRMRAAACMHGWEGCIDSQAAAYCAGWGARVCYGTGMSQRVARRPCELPGGGTSCVHASAPAAHACTSITRSTSTAQVAPAQRSQRRLACLSSEPEASMQPSSLQARRFTQPSWPRSTSDTASRRAHASWKCAWRWKTCSGGSGQCIRGGAWGGGERPAAVQDERGTPARF